VVRGSRPPQPGIGPPQRPGIVVMSLGIRAWLGLSVPAIRRQSAPFPTAIMLGEKAPRTLKQNPGRGTVVWNMPPHVRNPTLLRVLGSLSGGSNCYGHCRSVQQQRDMRTVQKSKLHVPVTSCGVFQTPRPAQSEPPCENPMWLAAFLLKSPLELSRPKRGYCILQNERQRCRCGVARRAA
jgi:hypothetical protein